MNRQEITNWILSDCVIAVVRLNDSSKAIPVVEAILEGGIKIIELTLTTPGAYSIVETLTSRFDKEILVGMGSVLSEDDAQKSIDAGAKYIVSPIFKRGIIDIAHKNNLPASPGCFTPTEIFEATEYGADIIKVFPADIVGMPFFKAIKAPMPHLKIMPTGGVTIENAGDWLKAGACAVGIGSALLNKEAIKNNNLKVIKENSQILLDNINIAKNSLK
ncbi:bifunctional 4-hydroxy-2-oxoglutarate aldolase/2-dehydro-3-deoxy-phosphogluconate aldolase [Bacteroidota bacterium]